MKLHVASFLAIAIASTSTHVSALLPLAKELVGAATDAVDTIFEEITDQCIVRLDDALDGNAVTELVEGLIGTLAYGKIMHVYDGAINGFSLNMPCSLAQTVLGVLGSNMELIPDMKVSVDRYLQKKKKGSTSGRNGGRKKKKKGGVRKKNTSTNQDTTTGTNSAASSNTSTGAPVKGTPKQNVARVGGARDGTGKTAWVLDTGIYTKHPHLNVDAARGFTAFSKSSGIDARLDDGHGHGTHVAGTIGAKPINGQLLGVAPNTKVVPVKVMKSDGSGSMSAILAGIDHVAKNAKPGDCVNLSLTAGASRTMDNAVVNAAASSGAYWVIAAGNYNSDANNYSPARAKGTNVFTISAVDAKDRVASFSNYGSSVDYAAVGVNVLSTYKDGGTSIMSGTSMAAPAACAVIMMTNGKPNTKGRVTNDKDSVAEPIIHL